MESSREKTITRKPLENCKSRVERRLEQRDSHIFYSGVSGRGLALLIQWARPHRSVTELQLETLTSPGAKLLWQAPDGI